MIGAATITESSQRCLDEAPVEVEPYRHSLDPPSVGDTKGRCETHNTSRSFFSADWRSRNELAFPDRPVA
jgi:hypothetical protein